MSKLTRFKKPPFYTTIYATPIYDQDAGLYSEALSTILSLATIQSGFLGLEEEHDAQGRPVKIAYWESFTAMNAWLEKASDLVPYKIGLEPCLGSCGCLWQWLDEDVSRSQNVA